ncbi:hypothetical protein PCK1_001651, partial [Pneumocystis canis]
MESEDLTSSETFTTMFNVKKNRFSQQYQALLDGSMPYKTLRWLGLLAFLALFMIRILVVQGWYIGTSNTFCYALGIYLLNLFLAFLTPKLDLSLEQDVYENQDSDL